ncbi:hypothetical protein ACFQZ4_08690 [Catellatospora coxensis]
MDQQVLQNLAGNPAAPEDVLVRLARDRHLAGLVAARRANFPTPSPTRSPATAIRR